ncbi:papilin [Tetranychus urticae]|uniref:BPTI/Kunitz inhibitor domain-containing protein n=1 Tax=Tetranychus urticae TaxID=32264 RepID=T1JPU0_TETUR|nr:papilin [Tetranychus urticae]XP_015791318.1 papilin [Tetranychus urticae]XP_015791327.1 papilin [Tetranychus urticae]
MVYQLLLAIPLLFSFAASTITEPSDCKNCPELKFTYHYAARGCNPVSRVGCPNCIERYECNSIQKEANKCYYAGESYDIDKDIKFPDPCNRCRCYGSITDKMLKAKISCALVECPGTFSSPNTDINNQTCYYSFKPGQCCGEKRCPDQKPMVTCSYEGNTYMEGQKIELPDCYTCSCTSDFNPMNVKNNPACYKHTCYFDTKMLDAGCLPVYTKSGCCYTQYHCPSPNLERRRNHCRQTHYYGYCQQNLTYYHFDTKTNQCLPFTFSGCGGTVNTFATLKACTDYCTAPDPIRPAPIPGKCYFDGVNYDIGSKLVTKGTYNCICSIPPDFTCVLKD